MPSWTRLDDPEAVAALLPAWFAGRMMGAQEGHFGLLLTTGDVLRVASLRAAHISEAGTILLDLMLDHAGVPAAADLAWRSKHFLGAPVTGAAEATVNLAHIVCAVDFSAAAAVETRPELAAEAAEAVSATVVELRQVAEEAAERVSPP
ncbi:hypothetical protein JMJ55_20820 [Belnapia sp. T6]|uniref:Uncharacterized protein n=1 Tax=Belnapia mucosa TaxID=2804532 RepID=A0ABS1V7Y7_9PROT|nr:hypothetical protein [Belnapia mucosa]MBL6457785.1 hypothetical protein [Belnapia mucosa]